MSDPVQRHITAQEFAAERPKHTHGVLGVVRQAIRALAPGEGIVLSHDGQACRVPHGCTISTLLTRERHETDANLTAYHTAGKGSPVAVLRKE